MRQNRNVLPNADDRYIGCFEDRRDDRVLSDASTIHGNMSIQTCISFCLQSGENAYAGVEHGNECFCGGVDADVKRHGNGTDRDCQYVCAGKPTESCGGLGFIAVFNCKEEYSNHNLHTYNYIRLSIGIITKMLSFYKADFVIKLYNAKSRDHDRSVFFITFLINTYNLFWHGWFLPRLPILFIFLSLFTYFFWFSSFLPSLFLSFI